jgi:hypothetical protein
LRGIIIITALFLAVACTERPSAAPANRFGDQRLALTGSINLFAKRVRGLTVLYFEPGHATAQAVCGATADRRIVADTMKERLAHRMAGRSVESMWDAHTVDDTTDHWVYGVWRIAPSLPPDAIQLRRDGKLLTVWAMRVSADTMPHLHALAVRDVGQGISLNKWSEFGSADSACAGPAITPRAALDSLLAGSFVQP